ncbi:MAG: hypothetical protein N2171_01300 [Clostridia bacterium]|nr:hypothetical protein [Clostridia bacterium]
MDKREIRKLKKEFEKLIKERGVDNLNDVEIVEKGLRLEEEMYRYSRKKEILA